MSDLLSKQAPAFSLQDQDGETHSLSDYKGEKILIYFYPKDSTPGCTMEACGFRNNLNSLKSHNVNIIGISTDSIESHKKFANKYKLNFPLLADINKEVVKSYGVWVEKSMFGKKYMGIQRDSFLIDEKGIVIKHYKKVKSAKHPTDVLKEFLQSK